MRQFSKKEKILAAVAGAALIGVSATQVHLPKFRSGANNAQQIKLKKRMLSNVMELISQKDKITEEIGMYGEYIKNEESPDLEKELLVGAIQDFAADAAVEVIDIKSFAPLKSGEFSEYKVEIEAEAPIDALSSFMYNIENSKKLMKIRKFRLSPKPEKEGILKVYLTVSKILVI